MTHIKCPRILGSQHTLSTANCQVPDPAILAANESFVKHLTGYNFLAHCLQLVLRELPLQRQKVIKFKNRKRESRWLLLSRFGARSWIWSAVVVVAALPRPDDLSGQGGYVQPSVTRNFRWLKLPHQNPCIHWWAYVLASEILPIYMSDSIK